MALLINITLTTYKLCDSGYKESRTGYIFKNKETICTMCLGECAVKILFIDYEALFADGLESLLQSSGLEFKGHYSKNIQEGLDIISEKDCPELIFLDINLYEDSNDHLIEGIHKLSAFAPVIIVSEIESLSFEKFMIDAGASGFICKSNNKNILFSAVKTVLNGKIYGDCHKLGNGYMHSNDEVKVTDRQYEILNLLSQGLLNKQIAGKLNISINTVNAHLHEIFRRLNVTNRTAAVQSAHKIGLI